MKGKVNIVTLGCSKNLVDSEILGAQLQRAGYRVEYDQEAFQHRIAILNTCGFIEEAKEESINTIFDYLNARDQGQLEKVYVMGCLSQRYAQTLKNEIPEVDRFFGVDNLHELLNELKVDYKKELLGERQLSTPGHYAYLKISEGCDRQCAFCAIPLIRGKHKSVPIPELVAQTEQLAAKGVKELILIAQDLSSYGLDIYQRLALPELLRALARIAGIEWIRLHYAYPLQFTDDIVQVMREEPKICHYLDIPLQHITDHMLKKMKRGNTRRATEKLLDTIRKALPDVALRTTLMVGYPGETEADFEALKAFVTHYRFEKLGVFTYSHEEDTYAWKQFADDVPPETKAQRRDEIMQLQQDISLEINQQKVGKQFRVLIDRMEGNFAVARTQYDSPEVDGEVLIARNDDSIKIGTFYDVTITRADDYDLYARLNAY